MIIKIQIKYKNILYIKEFLTYLHTYHHINIILTKKKNTVHINNIILIFIKSKTNELTFIYKNNNISANGCWNINDIILLPKRLQYIVDF